MKWDTRTKVPVDMSIRNRKLETPRLLDHLDYVVLRIMSPKNGIECDLTINNVATDQVIYYVPSSAYIRRVAFIT